MSNRELTYENFPNLPASSGGAATDEFPVLDAADGMVRMTLAQLADFIETGGSEDFTLSGATPSLIFKDTDATDTDINAQIEINLTDTGSGTEDADIDIRTQIGGTLTDVLVFDASTDTWTARENFHLSGAAPLLAMIDTDTDDSDISFQIDVNATATGTGAEDIDVNFQAQQGGVLTSFIVFDASDDAVGVGYSGGKVGFYGVAEVAQAAALTAAETTLTNAGTGGDAAIQALTSSTPFGFVTAAEGEQVVETVLNNQLRISEIETVLSNLGLTA